MPCVYVTNVNSSLLVEVHDHNHMHTLDLKLSLIFENA